MVPEEWPIAVESADRTVDSALARSPSRLATVRRDFFLDSSERLTEQERALMTAMLHDLVAALAACAFAQASRTEQSGIELPPGPWLFSRRNAIFVAIPFAIGGWWNGLLVTLLVYAAISFFIAQHFRHRLLRD